LESQKARKKRNHDYIPIVPQKQAIYPGIAGTEELRAVRDRPAEKFAKKKKSITQDALLHGFAVYPFLCLSARR
jgi:hypothetical protein